MSFFQIFTWKRRVKPIYSKITQLKNIKYFDFLYNKKLIKNNLKYSHYDKLKTYLYFLFFIYETHNQ